MDVEEKLLELNNQKVIIEGKVSAIQQNMVNLQQQLSNLNRDYLILIGKIECYEEMIKDK